jgi:RNA polymerase sigma-70 factor (ECF subfamily)
MSNRSLLLEWRQRWNRSLFQFLRKRVRSAVDVQDLAQETYLRLLRARDLSEVRNPLGYLLQVASHVTMEWCDRQPRSDSMVALDDATLVDDQLPELELDARMSQERLERTLAAVSPMMRAVLLLRLRDERSVPQIAADLQITVRQVRRHLARGYERLRVAIEG